MRIASPTAATLIPIASDRIVGRASTNTRRPQTKPSVTRSRASKWTIISRRVVRLFALTTLPALETCRLDREPPLDGADDLARFDVKQAHAIVDAAAQMMAAADRVPRHGHIVRRQRAVAGGTRRTVDADDRRAQRGCDVRWPGVA